MFISNDCVGARIYNLLRREFDNPFIWSRLKSEDFFYLIEHYDDNTINYENYSIANGSKNIINIDDKINPFYIHYIYDEKYKTPTKMTGKNSLDIHYDKITDYCIDKYKKRIQRFFASDKDPIFILNDKEGEIGYFVTKEDCFKFVDLKTRYLKILVTKKEKDLFDYDSKNVIIINKISENTNDIAKLVLKTLEKC